jgi:hypothetical protein
MPATHSQASRGEGSVAHAPGEARRASEGASHRQPQGAGRSPPRPPPNDERGATGGITIELTKAQVNQVVRATAQGGAMSFLLSALNDPRGTLPIEERWTRAAEMSDKHLSRSLLCGLLVLSGFPSDGSYRGIAELARTLDMNTSMVHRYVTTLLAAGLLERDPATRRYRLARV